MHPIYLSLGFANEHFISDFNVPKFTDRELRILQKFHSSIPPNKTSFFRLFVKSFFAMKGCTNEKFNYGKYYSSFEDLDYLLYSDLNKFYNEWKEFDLDDKEHMAENYRSIISELILSLVVWDMTN